jgi:hypothetical protein
MSQIIMIVYFVQMGIERTEIISFLTVILAVVYGIICKSNGVQVAVWFSLRRLQEEASGMFSSLK